MLGLRFLPKGKVGGIALFALSVQFTGRIQYIVQIAAGKPSVMVVFVVLGYIEIYGTFAFISVTGIENLLYQFDFCLLYTSDAADE